MQANIEASDFGVPLLENFVTRVPFAAMNQPDCSLSVALLSRRALTKFGTLHHI